MQSHVVCVGKRTCTFGDGLDGIVNVESNEVMILDCYCMTAERTGNKQLWGITFLTVVI